MITPGLFLVLAGRALHWPVSGGKPPLWAKQHYIVDLRHPVLCDVVNESKQGHKLIPVPEEEWHKHADKAVTTWNMPARIRERYEAYEGVQAAETEAAGAPLPSVSEAPKPAAKSKAKAATDADAEA